MGRTRWTSLRRTPPATPRGCGAASTSRATKLLRMCPMPRGSKILVVLADGSGGLPPAWRPSRARDRFTVVRSSGLATGRPVAGRIDVILYQVDDAGRPQAAMRLLKRLDRNALLVPFRLERSGGGASQRRGAGPARNTDPGLLKIGPTLAVRLLETLLDREKQLADQRQR